jgi:hypothetical protein
MSVLLTRSHQAFCQVLGHGGSGHYRHWGVEPVTVVLHLASSKVRCGWDCHCNIPCPAISDTTLLLNLCPLISGPSTQRNVLSMKYHIRQDGNEEEPTCYAYKSTIPRWQQSLVIASAALECQFGLIISIKMSKIGEVGDRNLDLPQSARCKADALPLSYIFKRC